MCGIAGILNFGSKEPVDSSVLRAMCDVLTHRGPDEWGMHVDGHAGIANRRLKIIDLTSGKQPIPNEDNTVHVILNGEIYNHLLLREELEKKGHRFTTHCDTEAIVHAYEEYGEDCVRKFNGMFAFCIWDARKQKMFLSRDRLGIKPLYYFERSGRLLFASEIKAILKDPSVPRKVNLDALYYYTGYEFVPGPDTMFEGIKKLLPGHVLTVENGAVATRQYWDLVFKDDAKPREYYEQEICRLLEDSARMRLMSDVPLGVFLSGGLDSSAILTMVGRKVSERIKTITIGYRDSTFSELEYAEYMSKLFDTEHHVIILDPVTEEDIEKTVWHLDEPMTDLSAIPLYMLCRKAKQFVTVVLSGEGGDEVFVGYDRFKASKFNEFYRAFPSFLRRPFERAILSLPDTDQKKGIINITKRFVQGAVLPPAGEHMRWQYFSSPRDDSLLYNDSFKKKARMDPFELIQDRLKKSNARTRLEKEIYIDTRFTMPDSVLMKVDKMSMAHAVEIRVPFLDYRLVELAASIPSRMKLEGFTTKGIFRTAMKGVLPDKILNRGKQGYSFPIKTWLRNEMREYMTRLLSSSPIITGNFNARRVKQLMDEHVSKAHNHNHVLWALINIAVWHKKFF